MTIDSFTLIAQVLNFLLLVWLLKRFLYGRIIEAMNDREAKIASRLEEAARMRAEAEREANFFRTKNRELDEQRDQLLAEARQQAEAYHRQLTEAARLEADKTHAQWLESLRQERQELLHDLRVRLGQQVCHLARHTLQELANADLEGQMLKVFGERLQALTHAEREALAAAVRDSRGEIEIRTAFPVSPELRDGLTRILREQLQLDEKMELRFATVSELLCGVEMRVQSQRLVWNLDSYLQSLEDRVFEVLEERAQKDGKHQ